MIDNFFPGYKFQNQVSNQRNKFKIEGAIINKFFMISFTRKRKRKIMHVLLSLDLLKIFYKLRCLLKKYFRFYISLYVFFLYT